MSKRIPIYVAVPGLVVLFLAAGLLGCQGSDGSEEADGDRVMEDEYEPMDILWMISNTSTMCGSQQMLRDGADAFAENLAVSDIDFHVAVTTSHMVEDATNEPVAQPGKLQATPQPVPGDSLSCAFAPYEPHHPDVLRDPEGYPHPGDLNPARLDPIVDQIDAAIECTQEPEQWAHLRQFDEAQLRCALPASNRCDEALHDRDDEFCLCPGGDDHGFDNCLDCDSLDERPSIESFYPAPDSYRPIDVVLRAADYLDDKGEMDLDQLRADFRCMSMVGTRGDGYNRGLEAVGHAVSPDMTGGVYADYHEALEVRDIYPNAGFLRDDGGDGGGDGGGRTAILFASAGNDCSHGGQLQQTACGVAECIIQENQGDAGALISTPELADTFVENVALSRGIDDVDALRDVIYPAAFLGQYQGLDGIEESLGEPIPDECSTAGPAWVTSGSFVVPESCRSMRGVAWSGHRYTHFMEEFSWYYPRPSAPGEVAEGGQMCSGLVPMIDEMFGPDLH